MIIQEVNLNDRVLSTLIRLSEEWTAEESCYGYRPNDKSDIEGNRIFLAKETEEVVGYLLGKFYPSEKMKSIMH